VNNSPFVAKQKAYFSDDSYKYAQLFSGSETDMIPMFSANSVGNKVNFQVPGGNGLMVDVIVAMKWAQAILDICQTAINYREAEAKE
jgi:hypothetical protein